MENKKYPTILLVLFVLTLWGCKEKSNTPPSANNHPQYYPSQTGYWIIYNVDSIWHDDPSDVHDTIQYQIKQVFDSVFIDQEGDTAVRIERYYRTRREHLPFDSSHWKIGDVWYANISKKGVETVEENNRFLKLLFPIKTDVTWNANLYNTLQNWDVVYKNIGSAYTLLGDLNFENTVTVEHLSENLIERFYSQEVYALNVGLISKTFQELRFYSPDQGGGIETGYEVFYQLSDYNN